MKTTRLFALTWLTGLLSLAASPGGPDAFNVVWDSPSANHHGSMPLGNGDIALNAWMTKDGDLQFYISKTDAWDDNARLVKVGKVRVHFEPNPVAAGKAFRQELKLAKGCIEMTVGDASAADQSAISHPQSTIRLWVDANDPVIYVTADSATPMEATAFIELWRTNHNEFAEVQCSDVLNHPGRPQSKHAPTILQPDTVLTGQRDRVGWFHHNVKSVGPRMMAQVQGLTGFQQPDPLLHRSFGAVITATGGERLDDLRLRSRRGKSHHFGVSCSRAILPRPSAGLRTWMTPFGTWRRRTSRHGARPMSAGGLGSGSQLDSRFSQHQCAPAPRVHRVYEQSCARRGRLCQPNVPPPALYHCVRGTRRVSNQVQRLVVHRAARRRWKPIPDYRRWGPGYWWQNTRLPYLSLCASGDLDLMRPLFHMYADGCCRSANTARGSISATMGRITRSA